MKNACYVLTFKINRLNDIDDQKVITVPLRPIQFLHLLFVYVFFRYFRIVSTSNPRLTKLIKHSVVSYIRYAYSH